MRQHADFLTALDHIYPSQGTSRIIDRTYVPAQLFRPHSLYGTYLPERQLDIIIYFMCFRRLGRFERQLHISRSWKAGDYDLAYLSYPSTCYITMNGRCLQLPHVSSEVIL